MLINRNITVGRHRTSIRLEPEFWERLATIAQRENVTIDELCTDIDRGAGGLSRTAAIRVFITDYCARVAQLGDRLNDPVRAPDADRYGANRAAADPKYAEVRYRAAG